MKEEKFTFTSGNSSCWKVDRLLIAVLRSFLAKSGDGMAVPCPDEKIMVIENG
jgi:hypothetical protein